ncbi:Dirigent protein 10 [Capsicum baccatum]|uniref:Dirigent protein n=1 Tax=Capsicum baccatum TaxID=33114 RepID=A0A2G2VN81_CAPBA|nr:Dirigent protein 10 [Capsicum baccatum]
MATPNSNVFQLKAIFTFLVILTLTNTSATSRRILDEPVTPTVAPEAPDDTDEAPASGVVAGTGVAAAATPIGAGVAVPSAHSDVSTTTTHAAVAAHAGADHVATAVASGVVDNGVPVNNGNSGIISNNNIPFLTGLSGTTPNVIQNNGNNNNIIGGGNGYPALNLAQLGSGVTFQKLLFGTMTVVDDELTEGHELNSGLVGKAQGFYIASSEDGTSQTMAFTVMLHSGSYSDSLACLGFTELRVSESHLAIMGGTGKYVNAKGFATVKTFPAANQQTDGVETLLHITVYIAY